MPIALDNHTQPPSQQCSEKIYQPLIPSKTYKSQPTKTWPLRQNTLGQRLIIQRVSTILSRRMMRTVSTSHWILEGVGHLRRGRTNHWASRGRTPNYSNHHPYMNWTMTLLTLLNTLLMCFVCFIECLSVLWHFSLVYMYAVFTYAVLSYLQSAPPTLPVVTLLTRDVHCTACSEQFYSGLSLCNLVHVASLNQRVQQQWLKVCSFTALH